jgi:hypothetical protein
MIKMILTHIPLRFSSIACFLTLFSFGAVAQDVYLCVWRNPERTMNKIFPDARDYKTVNHAITEKERVAIEDKIGFELLPGQRDQFQYFNMTGNDGKIIGVIIAASQKGEFGAIEFVMGFDTAGVIKDIYIQRSRERDQRFKNREFLDSFKGVSIPKTETLKTLHNDENSPGMTAVITGVLKELVAYNFIVKNGGGVSQ